MLQLLSALAAIVATATAHGDHTQEPLSGPHKSLWYNTLPGDGGTQVNSNTPTHADPRPFTTIH